MTASQEQLKSIFDLTWEPIIKTIVVHVNKSMHSRSHATNRPRSAKMNDCTFAPVPFFFSFSHNVLSTKAKIFLHKLLSFQNATEEVRFHMPNYGTQLPIMHIVESSASRSTISEEPAKLRQTLVTMQVTYLC